MEAKTRILCRNMAHNSVRSSYLKCLICMRHTISDHSPEILADLVRLPQLDKFNGTGGALRILILNSLYGSAFAFYSGSTCIANKVN